ncbi:MAG: hypothetical protein QE493_06265 [Verrucomicrobiae bacterium]|nr:hypothetical protein [Verrucomicrobiae bacterium]
MDAALISKSASGSMKHTAVIKILICVDSLALALSGLSRAF